MNTMVNTPSMKTNDGKKYLVNDTFSLTVERFAYAEYDIIVAIGGIASLFLGSSFLNGLKLFYHLFRGLRA